jgi:hypothetical protein
MTSTAAGQKLSDLPTRREYDAEVAGRLSPGRTCSSSPRTCTSHPGAVGAPRRAINIHGSDLARLGADDAPYTGLRAVADAILSGESRRARALVTERSIAPGPAGRHPCPSQTSRRGTAAAAYAYAHQEWMLADAWGVWRTALRHVAPGSASPARAHRSRGRDRRSPVTGSASIATEPASSRSRGGTASSA